MSRLRHRLVVSAFAVSTLSGGTQALAAESENLAERVFGAPRVGVCEFPATPMTHKAKTSMCTATLVHPQVIVFASHCMKLINQGKVVDVDHVRFREAGSWKDDKAPGVDIVPEKCGHNDAYQSTYHQGVDWAYCTLKEPVKGFPIVPIARGCELDAVKVGAKVMVAGFGADSADPMSPGIKRWAWSQISSIKQNTIHISKASTGPCNGDSGGGLLAQLKDGSWRTIGIASTMEGSCGEGRATYARLSDKTVAWLERESGFDLTPCFDEGGQWKPTKGCRNFLKSKPGKLPGKGTWGESFEDSCEESEFIQWSAACGEPFAKDDTKAPELKIESPQDKQKFGSGDKVKVKFTASDDGEIEYIKLRVGGKTQTYCEKSPCAAELSELKDGEHKIEAIAEDLGGNKSVETVTIVIGKKEGGDDDDDDTSSSGESDDTSSGSDEDDSSKSGEDDSSSKSGGDSSKSSEKGKDSKESDEEDDDEDNDEDSSSEEDDDKDQKLSKKVVRRSCALHPQSPAPLSLIALLGLGLWRSRRRLS